MNSTFRPGQKVIWWQDARRGGPYQARIVKVRAKRITIVTHDPTGGSGEVIRHVAPDRLQPVGEYYEKAADQGPAIWPSTASWGRFVRYLHIGEDLRALRQIDAFENGKVLSYDRSHWVDDFGILADGWIDRNCKQGSWGRSEEIAAVHFERLWKKARRSALWRQQQATAQMAA